MNDENIKELQKLSKTCRNSGVLPIFLGLIVIFAGVISKDVSTTLVGLFIFIVGYAFVKIAGKISSNLQ